MTPVESLSWPEALTDEAVWPAGGRQRRSAVSDGGGLHAGGDVDRVQHVGDRAGLQIDRRVAAAVGDDVAADARAAGTAGAPVEPGTGAFLKVMTWPSTFSVEPSWTSEPSEARWWCGPR